MQHRPLLLRGNRFLGSALVDKGLITVETLDQANQRLLEVLQTGNLKQASLLYVLLYDLHALSEEALLTHLVDEYSLPLVDLHGYELERSVQRPLDMDLCWTSWTVPFDRVEDVWFVASAYYLSQPVVKHWNNLLGDTVIWYGASFATMTEALDRLETAGAGTAPPEAGAPA